MALDHYARLCEGLREAGIAPVVTFHHFTTPLWLADQGGWERDDMPERFAAYCEKAAGRLDGLMERACTINEPSMVSTIGYLGGAFPPGQAATGTPATTSTRCSCAPTAPRSTPSAPTHPACRSASRWP